MGTSKKPKTEKQIQKWLADPYSDSAEYRLWGNGIALPCAYFVLAGIAWAAQCKAETKEWTMAKAVFAADGKP